jgi:16S rRNA processing protein RimM
MSVPPPSYLLIGEILRPHGVAGELRMRVLTAYPERLPDLTTIFLSNNPAATAATPYPLKKVRMHQGYALLTLEGIQDRDQADRLRQLYVMVPLDDAIPLEAGEHYIYQLIGLQVRTEQGEVLGELTEVLDTRANDVYVVKSEQYGEVLIPVTPDTILETNIHEKFMIVRLPEGLLPA